MKGIQLERLITLGNFWSLEKGSWLLVGCYFSMNGLWSYSLLVFLGFFTSFEWLGSKKPQFWKGFVKINLLNLYVSILTNRITRMRNYLYNLNNCTNYKSIIKVIKTRMSCTEHTPWGRLQVLGMDYCGLIRMNIYIWSKCFLYNI